MLYDIKLQVCIQKRKLKIKKLMLVNVSKKICKLQIAYGRDNTKQAEMPYFHCGPSRQEKNLIRLDQNGEKINIKK